MNRQIQPPKSVAADDHAKQALTEAQNEHAATISHLTPCWIEQPCAAQSSTMMILISHARYELNPILLGRLPHQSYRQFSCLGTKIFLGFRNDLGCYYYLAIFCKFNLLGIFLALTTVVTLSVVDLLTKISRCLPDFEFP